LPKERHKIGKKYTISIEQNNSNVRHYLARMTRRTKVVSKSAEMVDLSLRLCCYLNEMDGFEKYQNEFLSIFS
jgi:insertion element IS1 protein InsB